ncbi:caprin-2 isoform X3 [Psammomys obesus]|uniref:caprin-2 isoform X3 n=1 Tax=Psammomys obesus TaxID=48139 RepID=UPI002452FC7D|nr:caprin-2 isoform X3 [Psammomys obesus]
MVQLSSSLFGYQSPSGHSEEGRVGNMKSAKSQVNHNQHGESQRAQSPQQSTLSSAASPSQAYEIYIDNGLICLKHKIRNIEKKKIKLEDYKDRLKNGEQLNADQLEAVEKYEEVLHNLEFAKELQKTFSVLSQDLLKAQKKAQRREHMLKLEAEKKKLRTVLHIQYVLQILTQEHVQKDFKGGLNGALCLPSKELDYLIKFSKLTCPERNESLSVGDQMEQSSLYFWDLLEGSEKAVVGTTYKHVKDLLSKLLNSGYFESIPVLRNSKEKEEEMIMQTEKKKQLLKTKTDLIKEPESLMEVVQPEIQPQEFLNRHYMTEVNYSRKQEKEECSWEADYARKPSLLKCWNKLSEADAQGKKQESSESWESSLKSHEVSKPVVSSEQGKLRSALQEEQKQQISVTPVNQWKPGTPKSKVGIPQEEQNMQDMPKPWVVQPQKEQEDPKKLPPGSWTVQSEQSSSRSWTAPVCPEQTSLKPGTPWANSTENQKPALVPQSEVCLKSWGAASAGLLPNDQVPPRKLNVEPKDVPKPMPQPVDSSSAFPKDPVLRKEKLKDLMSQIQGTCNFMQESVLDFDKPSSAIASSQLPSASPVSTVSAEQNLSNQSDFLQEPLQMAAPPCKPASTLASPNPSLSKGFHLPPASGSSAALSTAPFQAMQTVFNVDAPLPPQKEQDVKASPFSPGCSQHSTSSRTHMASQCPLPPAHTEQTAQPPETAAGCHPDGTVHVSNSNLAFYPAPTSMFHRPAQPFISSRGSVRGCARGGRLLMNPCRSPGGYKGFDSYRGPPSASSGNYSQLQLQAREYPGTPYSPRDNFQQCYKRSGTANGLQAHSKGWSDSSQVSSPERDSETLNSGDSGQGESRSMTPVDVPATSPTAATLPVHACPLPQQMRVAFSAARTSNLAPGTLDQPIVFDLLLNNLGETFDLQLGRFSCPVNGTYVFIFHMLKLAVNVPLYVNLMKNEEVLVSAYANDGAPDHETASNHAILQLLQGDQIWLRLHRGAIYGSSWKYSTFSGYLLYQD